jgi:hypothetical protein
MLKIDKCRDCHHFVSFKGLASLYDADKTGMCIEAGDNNKKWIMMSANETCPNFKDRVGAKIIENAKATKPADILKATDAPGKCQDCENWNAPQDRLSTYCTEVQRFVNANAYCPKYKECSKHRILKTKPVEIVRPAMCKNCEHMRGDKTQKAVWCNKKAESVDATHWCKDCVDAPPPALAPIPSPTPIQPENEIGPGDKFEAVVGHQMTLLWVGEQLVIGKDESGKEHGFDKKTMRFQKC